MKRRPVIGISGPDRGGYVSWWFSALAVRRAGGKPRRLTPRRGFKLDELDGLIIGGGADIAPETGMPHELSAVRQAMQRSHMRHWYSYLLYPLIYLLRRLLSIKHVEHYDPQRDDLEFRLIQAAFVGRLPVLGICRGAQLINSHLGGSLYEDIREFYEEAPLPRSIFPVKPVTIVPESRLRAILGRGQCRVNALHHQAVDALGRGVKISAREDNGLVQAIEVPGQAPVLGVQWHPEYMPLDATQRRLFHSLVAAASPGR